MKYDLYNHFIEGCFWGDLNRKEGFNHVSHERALQFLMLDRELFVKGVFVMKSSTVLKTKPSGLKKNSTLNSESEN